MIMLISFPKTQTYPRRDSYNTTCHHLQGSGWQQEAKGKRWDCPTQPQVPQQIKEKADQPSKITRTDHSCSSTDPFGQGEHQERGQSVREKVETDLTFAGQNLKLSVQHRQDSLLDKSVDPTRNRDDACSCYLFSSSNSSLCVGSNPPKLTVNKTDVVDNGIPISRDRVLLPSLREEHPTMNNHTFYCYENVFSSPSCYYLSDYLSVSLKTGEINVPNCSHASKSIPTGNNQGVTGSYGTEDHAGTNCRNLIPNRNLDFNKFHRKPS